MAGKTVNVGLIGYAFMGKAHSAAFRDVGRYFPDLKLKPVMKAICGRDEAGVREARERLGWDEFETDALKLIQRPDIELVDIASPGWAHKEQVIAAAKAGKNILCEKPIANNLAEAKEMARAVREAGVKSFVMFNYRRVPALALARDLIQSGEIGEIRHFRAFYLQDWISDPEFPMVWRLDKSQAGSGALGDIGSHIIDMGRFLVGEIAEVCGTMRTFVEERPLAGQPGKTGKVTVDDAAAWMATFENGTLGTFEATRFALGRKNFNGFELYGSKGSLVFNFEDMNRLQFYSAKDGETTRGFRDILVTEASHPYVAGWWPPGHIIGYQHTFVHAVHDFLQAIAEGRDGSPNMEDGVRVQAVLEAVELSSRDRQWVKIADLL